MKVKLQQNYRRKTKDWLNWGMNTYINFDTGGFSNSMLLVSKLYICFLTKMVMLLVNLAHIVILKSFCSKYLGIAQFTSISNLWLIYY